MPLCSACHTLQDLPEGLSFYETLGLPVQPLFPVEEVRARYHSMASICHPDRYAGKPGQEALFAARWSQALSQAYKTLKDRETSLDYFVSRLVQSSKPPQMPHDLAEEYFELQENLSASNSDAMLSFAKRIGDLTKNTEISIDKKSADWPKASDPSRYAAELQQLLHRKKYLLSMQRDIGRKLEGIA